MNDSERVPSRTASYRILFFALETLTMSASLAGIWLARHQQVHASLFIRWYVTVGVFIAPIALIVTAAFLYRKEKLLFWIGIVTVAVVVVLMLLPLVPASQ